jgi:PhnB protein
MGGDEATTGPAGVKLAPWLSVADAAGAVEFHLAAFGAVELERLEDDAGSLQVARLGIGGAEFWVQQDAGNDPPSLGGRSPVRMILTVDDPDAVFARAVRAGAREVFPVGEGNGWRVGRVSDPSGHHWEVGKPLTPG